jgi:hypothetical protein
MDHGLQLRCRQVCPRLPHKTKRDAEHHHSPITVPARASPVAKETAESPQQDHQRVAHDYQQAHEPPLPAFLRYFIWPCGPFAFFGLRLRQARGSCTQELQQPFAVLPGGI